MTQRHLVVVRHARAEAPEAGGPDHARSLTDRGVRDARELGQWLKQQGVHPDVVLCSPAARTRETWAGITEGSGYGTLVEHDQRIYNAGIDGLLAVLREVDDKRRTVVLLGHAPGMPWLAAALTEGAADLPNFEDVFRPSGCAVLSIEVPWSELAAGTAAVEAVHVGAARD